MGERAGEPSNRGAPAFFFPSHYRARPGTSAFLKSRFALLFLGYSADPRRGDKPLSEPREGRDSLPKRTRPFPLPSPLLLPLTPPPSLSSLLHSHYEVNLDKPLGGLVSWPLMSRVAERNTTAVSLKKGQTAKTWVEATVDGEPVRLETNFTLTWMGKAQVTLQIEQVALGVDREEGEGNGDEPF